MDERNENVGTTPFLRNGRKEVSLPSHRRRSISLFTRLQCYQNGRTQVQTPMRSTQGAMEVAKSLKREKAH